MQKPGGGRRTTTRTNTRTATGSQPPHMSRRMTPASGFFSRGTTAVFVLMAAKGIGAGVASVYVVLLPAISLFFLLARPAFGVFFSPKRTGLGTAPPFADGGGVRTRRPAVRVLPGVLRPAQRDARHERADPRAEIIRRDRRIFPNTQTTRCAASSPAPCARSYPLCSHPSREEVTCSGRYLPACSRPGCSRWLRWRS